MAQEETTYHNLEDFLSSSLSSHTKIRFEYRWKNFGDEKISCLSTSLEKCINLTHLHLDLSHNKIGEQGAQSLFSSLQKCINLQNLHLSIDENKIGDKNVQNLGLTLQSLKNLSYLYLCLNFNEIQSEGVIGFSAALKNCTTIVDFTLTLSNNNIDDSGLTALAAGLADCINLKNLTLSICSNQPQKDLINFGIFLSRGKFEYLELYIGWYDIDQEDVIEFGSKLAECAYIKYLSLSMTGIKMTGESASGLVSALSNCMHLQNLVLCLSFNEIRDASIIGSSFTKFRYLKTLHIDLGNNYIFYDRSKINNSIMKMNRLVKKTIKF